MNWLKETEQIADQIIENIAKKKKEDQEKLVQEIEEIKKTPLISEPRIKQTFIKGFLVKEERCTTKKPGYDANQLNTLIRSHNRISQQTEELTETIQKKAELLSELKTIGINPIAILPKIMWVNICKKFGLFRFEDFNSHGEVNFNWKNIESLYITILVPISLIPIVSLICYYSYFSARSVFLSNTVGIIISLMLLSDIAGNSLFLKRSLSVPLMLIALTTPIILNALNPKLSELHQLSRMSRIGIFAAQWLASVCGLIIGIKMGTELESGLPIYLLIMTTPKRLLKKAMWPQKSDKISVSDDKKIRITFPNPPEKFANLLQRLVENKWNPLIAADAAAINFSKRELAGKVVEAAQERKRKAEPIIYVEKDGLVAIIDRFGDFQQSEKKAINYVKKNCHIILSAYFFPN